MILAAGKGTRLAPLTSWRAKALVPVGDRPALEHVVERVRSMARVVVVNTHHRADEVEAFARSHGLGVSHEEELLGTAGGLEHAAELLGAGDVLVWNSDMVGGLDAGDLARAHVGEVRRGALATLAVRLCEGRGNVGLDVGGRIVRLREETCAGGETRGAEFVGVHVVSAGVRRALPRTGCLVGDVYLPALRRGERLASWVADAPMTDVGSPQAYVEANLAWLTARRDNTWRGVRTEVDDDARLDRVVLGDGARVVGAGRVEACVVWPGAVVNAPIARAIITTEGIARV
jgi:mannose-1-phosphate guanylyltransferase